MLVIKFFVATKHAVGPTFSIFCHYDTKKLTHNSDYDMVIRQNFIWYDQ